MVTVVPKRDCPHVHSLDFASFSRKQISIDAPCQHEGCGAKGENWICCFCGSILCSRYVAGHAAEHAEKEPDHCISVSFADCSCWCYKCDSYIEDPVSINFVRQVQRAKFGPEAFTPAPAKPVPVGPVGEETVLKNQVQACFDIRDAQPGESLVLENCSGCVVNVQSPLFAVRFRRCKECTIRVQVPVTVIDLEDCAGITIRQLVPARNTSLGINRSAAVAVVMEMDPLYTFFSSVVTRQSVVGINTARGRVLIPIGPTSSTLFNAETKAFETKAI